MRVLIPVPSTDFDPTESAIPWTVLTGRGHDVVFATPDGRPAGCDPRMISGAGLGPWSPILRARADAREAYVSMTHAPAWSTPLTWDAAERSAFDALLLPGGHAPGMKPYLESKTLQTIASTMLAASRPVAAICHGVLVLARATNATGPILRGRRVTALTRSMEMSAWAMTGLWLGSYYRTYPESVQDEVTRALGPDGRFEEGPFAVARDAPDRLARGFVVKDGTLLTARWPGDAWRFATDFAAMLAEPRVETASEAAE